MSVGSWSSEEKCEWVEIKSMGVDGQGEVMGPSFMASSFDAGWRKVQRWCQRKPRMVWDHARSLQGLCIHSEGNEEPLEGSETRSHIMWLGLNRTSPVRRKPRAETERPVMPYPRTETMVIEKTVVGSEDGQILDYLKVDRMRERTMPRFRSWELGGCSCL